MRRTVSVSPAGAPDAAGTLRIRLRSDLMMMGFYCRRVGAKLDVAWTDVTGTGGW